MMESPSLLSYRLHKVKTEDNDWLSNYTEFLNFGDFNSNKFIR